MQGTEQPLVFTRGDDALVFPAVPEDGRPVPPVVFANPLATTVDFDSEDAYLWRGIGRDIGLPAGWSNKWEVNEDGSIHVKIPVTHAQWGKRLELNAYMHLPQAIEFEAFVAWTAVPGHLPIPGEGAAFALAATDGADYDRRSWIAAGHSFVVKEGAASVDLTLTFTNTETTVGTVQVSRLEVVGDDDANAGVVWACLPAKDDHLAGLWSLPAMLGEIEDNVLYGGGLAPAAPVYGPRPVTYRLYGAAGSRSTLDADLRRVMAFLAAGQVEADNNGYGFTRAGFLAAPPEVEWLGNERAQVEVTLVMTFLDPAIYGAEGADVADSTTWVRQPAAVTARGLSWSGHVALGYGTDQEGYRRAVIHVTNDGTLPMYPRLACHVAPTPAVYGQRPGFAMFKLNEWDPPTDEDVVVHLGGVVWYANDASLSDAWVLYDPVLGVAYDVDGNRVAGWPDAPEFAARTSLRLEPGETARYVIAETGVAASSTYPPVPLNDLAGVLFVAANY